MSRLRVGILLDGPIVGRWTERIVRGVLDDDRFELALVVMAASPPPRPRLPVRLWRQRGRLLWTLYERMDARVAGSPHDALATVDLTQALAGVRTITVAPERPRPFEDRFSEPDLQRIRGEKLDVILRFGFGILRGGILTAAREGVWSYHHGDNSRYRGGPPHFWEMRDAEPVTGTILQVLTEELDGGHVIYRSWSATDPASLHRGRARTYAKSAEFMLRRLADVHRHGPDWLQTLPGQPAEKGELYRAPGNVVMAGFLIRLVAGWLRRRLRRALLRGQWSLAVRETPDPSAPPGVAGGGWTVVRPPASRFYADPFVADPHGSAALIFEDYDEGLGRARIASLGLPLDGSPPVPALELECHLSYPFVVEDGGEWLMIPESAERGTLELFRAVELPSRWEHDTTLMEGADVYDATVMRRDGRWWMWATVAVEGGPVTDELSLFTAEALRGPWIEHPQSPVVSDVRRARSAGPIFEHGGRLIRPAQDSSGRYGRAIVLHEVTVLTAERYEEVVIGRIDPGDVLAGNQATHTYQRAGRYEVVDVNVPRLRLPWRSRS